MYKKRTLIIPNNDKILDIISKIKKYTPVELKIINKFKSHVEAFKKHCFDEEFDYTEFQFPIVFSSLINRYTYKQKSNSKYFTKYCKWIDKLLSENNIKVDEKFIYGSCLYSYESNDLDLLLYIGLSSIDEIKEISKKLRDMENDFYLFFSKNLHVQPYFKPEYNLYENFKLDVEKEEF